MKGIIRGRKPRRKFNGHTYHYFNMLTRHEETIELDELQRISQTLPVRVKAALKRIELFKVPLTPQEQREALLLCSLSIYCWKGSPRCDLPGVSMEDYSNEFYIEMVKALRTWDPERGYWASYVKFVRSHAIRASRRRWEGAKRNNEVLHSVVPKEVKPVDFGTLQRLGLQVSEGRRVVNSNRP